jgi:hypothetical protein
MHRCQGRQQLLHCLPYQLVAMRALPGTDPPPAGAHDGEPATLLLPLLPLLPLLLLLLLLLLLRPLLLGCLILLSRLPSCAAMGITSGTTSGADALIQQVVQGGAGVVEHQPQVTARRGLESLHKVHQVALACQLGGLWAWQGRGSTAAVGGLYCTLLAGVCNMCCV